MAFVSLFVGYQGEITAAAWLEHSDGLYHLIASVGGTTIVAVSGVAVARLE